MLGTFSAGIAKKRQLSSALGTEVLYRPKASQSRLLSGVIGWGLKRNTRKARTYATRHRLPYISLEDGFIRSIGLGVDGAESFGFTVDRNGVYYDATRPCDVENRILNGGVFDTCRIRSLIDAIVRHQIYKYNHAWNSIEIPKDERPKILCIDQTLGDKSVAYGMADESSFRRMLISARERYPDGAIFIKTHPDVIAGRKKGYLTRSLSDDVTLITKDCNPMSLLRQVDHVYTVTSQMGFEALLLGKKVSCFGMPFYAGWGLTDDDAHHPRRGVSRSLEIVFESAYVHHSRYVDPLTGRSSKLDQVIDRIVAHKRVACGHSGHTFCFGFRFWKRGIIRRFLQSPNADVKFPRSVSEALRLGCDSNSRIAVWGVYDDPEVMQLARQLKIRVERVEDGFLRSVGLGSDFTKPSSLIVDRRGIYFDPSTASDLEELLNTARLDVDARRRGKKLRRAMIASAMSKYNTGNRDALETDADAGQTIILVPGQVEDDASINVGCPDIMTNLDLLNMVRRDNPHAYIIYKPHPDVIARNRRGALSPKQIRDYCDQIVTDRDITVCLDLADEVHTMTSLTGFEALIRGITVHTYGLPFYAGWGLTSDRHHLSRRKQRRTIDELIYCALILYPRYYSWHARCFVDAEPAAEGLLDEVKRVDLALEMSLAKRLIKKTINLIMDFREAITGG